MPRKTKNAKKAKSTGVRKTIRASARTTRSQVQDIIEREGELPPPPPPQLRRQRAVLSAPEYNMTRYRDSMNTVSMELIRFMENKIIREEKIKRNNTKKEANIAIKVLRQLAKIPEQTLPQVRKYTARLAQLRDWISVVVLKKKYDKIVMKSLVPVFGGLLLVMGGRIFITNISTTQRILLLLLQKRF